MYVMIGGKKVENVKQCKVFISSPSDLSKERELIAQHLENIKQPGIIFKPIRWEIDLPNTSVSSAQSLINEELLKGADILVGIFSTRFGSKTDHADSGTVDEIETFIAKGKPVILYFYNKTVMTAELSSEEITNLMKINEFKEKYAEKHIYSNINGIEELISALDRDIKYNMRFILSQPLAQKTTQMTSQKVSSKSTPRNRRSQRNRQSKPWYMDSIADLINDYLKKKDITFDFKGNLTFHENLQFLMGTTTYTAFVEQQFLEGARINAFNSKYGNYNYLEDLRDRFPQWSNQLMDRILKLKPDFASTSNRVLDVGGNDGSELISVFQDFPNTNFTVVDISDVAIDNGRKKYSHIEFFQNDMEKEYLTNVELFDVCLCLRAIQSRGVFIHDAIIQMCKHLNKDGILIISIPNGYKYNDKVERGLYDHRSRLFLRTKPQELAMKIERKLMDYNFIETGIETIDTEIIVWGKGRDIK